MPRSPAAAPPGPQPSWRCRLQPSCARWKGGVGGGEFRDEEARGEHARGVVAARARLVFRHVQPAVGALAPQMLCRCWMPKVPGQLRAAPAVRSQAGHSPRVEMFNISSISHLSFHARVAVAAPALARSCHKQQRAPPVALQGGRQDGGAPHHSLAHHVKRLRAHAGAGVRAAVGVSHARTAHAATSTTHPP